MDSVRWTELLSNHSFLGGPCAARTSHTLAQEQTFVSSLISCMGEQSTMQNFDASDANFRAGQGRIGSAELTLDCVDSAIISLLQKWTLISSSRSWKSPGRAAFLARARRYSDRNQRSARRSVNWSRSMVIVCSTARAKR